MTPACDGRVGRGPVAQEAVREVGEQVDAAGGLGRPRAAARGRAGRSRRGRSPTGVSCCPTWRRRRPPAARSARPRARPRCRCRRSTRSTPRRAGARRSRGLSRVASTLTSGSVENAATLSSSTHSESSSTPPTSAICTNGSALDLRVAEQQPRHAQSAASTSAYSVASTPSTNAARPSDEPEAPPDDARERRRGDERQRQQEQPEPAGQGHAGVAVEQHPEAARHGQREHQRVRLAGADAPRRLLAPPHAGAARGRSTRAGRTRPAAGSARGRARRRTPTRTSGAGA